MIRNVMQSVANKVVPRVGVEPTRDYSQRILSPNSSSSPSLTKHDKPIFTGMVSRRSQLHPGRFDVRSRRLHVIRPMESHSVAHVTFLTKVESLFARCSEFSQEMNAHFTTRISTWRKLICDETGLPRQSSGSAQLKHPL